MKIYLARTQGFCSGVTYATKIVEDALKKYGAPIYVYHEIVHNTFVVNSFKTSGVIFVESLAEVPNNATLIFSAHGVAPDIITNAKQKKLRIIDATCPLVKRVHQQAAQLSDKGFHVILIGHKGHQEVIGTAGYIKPKQLHLVETLQDIQTLTIPETDSVGYVTQTTLSVDETRAMITSLKKRFPKILAPDHSDICYATQNRQDAIKELAEQCDLIIVCGSKNSSNSNRLRETGERCGVKSMIIDSAAELDLEILSDKKNIGISSGASVPSIIVENLLKKMQKRFPNAEIIRFENPEDKIKFKLPEI